MIKKILTGAAVLGILLVIFKFLWRFIKPVFMIIITAIIYGLIR
jgi:uncharacterized membrane protein (DUF106 family)